MKEKKKYIQQLLNKYYLNCESHQDLEDLYKIIGSEENEDLIKEYMDGFLLNQTENNNLDKEKWDRVLSSILNSKGGALPHKTVKIKRSLIYAAAAVLIPAFFLIAGYNYFNKNQNNANFAEIGVQLSASNQNAKQTFKAKLYLSSSEVKNLNNDTPLLINTTNGVTIENKNGVLNYNSDNDGASLKKEDYHILVAPTKGTYKLELSDGSKVYLNSESKLMYPVRFKGNNRKVQLEGEAYFEIAHNPEKPFIVEIGKKREIEVLGTHFNVANYQNESFSKTTLLQGSVAIKSHKNRQVIKPGEQISIHNESGNMTINTQADIGKTMAWVNGFFNFNNDNLESIFKQAERWYGVKFETPQTFDFKINGRIPRKTSLDNFLKIIETSNNIKFTKNNGLITFKLNTMES